MNIGSKLFKACEPERHYCKAVFSHKRCPNFELSQDVSYPSALIQQNIISADWFQMKKSGHAKVVKRLCGDK